MDPEQLRSEGLILLEAISGSQSQGLATPESDTDIKGVFTLPRDEFFGLHYLPQVSDESHDVVFYELKRFFELLTKNNPNLLELLATPEDCVISRHPIMDRIRVADFVSKLCKDTFAGYAATQVRRARGLNKKIHNPMPEERLTVLDFCYVAVGQGSVAVMEFLRSKGMDQEDCGLVNVPHMHDVFAVFHDPAAGFRGLLRSTESLDLALSSIPTGLLPVALMSYNRSGYSKHCKDHKGYWSWVRKRNEARYAGTIAHGKNYDAKNMMHTFRLLSMAEEIGRTGEINVRRSDREELLRIRSGHYDYEDLLARAEEKLASVEDAFADSSLPAEPDVDAANRLLVEMRTELLG